MPFNGLPQEGEVGWIQILLVFTLKWLFSDTEALRGLLKASAPPFMDLPHRMVPKIEQNPMSGNTLPRLQGGAY